VEGLKQHQVQSGGAVLAAQTIGGGAGVVFLHAGVADHRMWLDQIAGVASTHAAISYDRRGFGATSAPEEAYSHVGDLLAVLDALTDGAPVVLVGCSQGGRIAIDAALERPERVRGLVLFAPALTGAPPEDDPPALAARIAELEAAEEADDLERVNALEAEFWLDGPLQQAGRVGGEPRRLFLAMNGTALRSPPVGAATPAPSAYDRLAQIAAPTLIICGDLDFPSLIDRCGYMAKTMPRARLDMMDGVAHLPSLERPQATTRLIRRFLDDLSI
jgi:pimeloyl-ACP methyl ester carboxylesterase